MVATDQARMMESGEHILKNPSEEKLREFWREIVRDLTREFSRKVENPIEKMGPVHVRFTVPNCFFVQCVLC